MKFKTMIAAVALACNAAYGFTVDPDIYFAIAKMDQGRFTFLLSRQTCKTSSADSGQWLKAGIYVQYDVGGTDWMDACWMKDKQPNGGNGQPVDLKVCALVNGVIRTPCRKATYDAFRKVSDLPKVPSRADF